MVSVLLSFQGAPNLFPPHSSPPAQVPEFLGKERGDGCKLEKEPSPPPPVTCCWSFRLHLCPQFCDPGAPAEEEVVTVLYELSPADVCWAAAHEETCKMFDFVSEFQGVFLPGNCDHDTFLLIFFYFILVFGVIFLLCAALCSTVVAFKLDGWALL